MKPAGVLSGMQQILVAIGLVTSVINVHADCWDDAERRYGVSRYLLLAIAQQESGLNPLAINVNRDGSYDIGLMQINTRWLGQLRTKGITSHDLFQPCMNLQVGAWILANNFARFGRNWRAVGAYNASTEGLRRRYAWQVAQTFGSIAREYRLDEHKIDAN